MKGPFWGDLLMVEMAGSYSGEEMIAVGTGGRGQYIVLENGNEAMLVRHEILRSGRVIHDLDGSFKR